MKSLKNLEKLLNKKGFELRYEKYGYYDNVPVAYKKSEYYNIENERIELKIYLVYDIINYDNHNSTIIGILSYNLTRKEIENVIEKVEYNFETQGNYYEYTNRGFGRIEIRNGKVKRINYIDEVY